MIISINSYKVVHHCSRAVGLDSLHVCTHPMIDLLCLCCSIFAFFFGSFILMTVSFLEIRTTACDNWYFGFAAFRSSARSIEFRKFDNGIRRTCSYRIWSYSFLCFGKSKTLNILSTVFLISRFLLEHDHVQMQSFPFSPFGAIEVYGDLKSRLCWGLDVHKVSSGS